MEENHDNVIAVDFSSAQKTKSPVKREREVPIKNLEKLRVFEDFLAHGIASVVFDPRSDSVKVPEHFRNDAQMVLNFSYRFHIDDFRFDNDGVGATLTFQDGYSFCYIPWEKVFSIFSEKLQRSSAWPEDTKKPHLTLIDEP